MKGLELEISLSEGPVKLAADRRFRAEKAFTSRRS